MTRPYLKHRTAASGAPVMESGPITNSRRPAFPSPQLCVRILLMAILFASAVPGQVSRSESDPGPSTSPPVGEKLVFLVEWKPPWYLFFLPPMEAGEAELNLTGEVEYKGRKALKIEFIARSSGTLSKLAGIQVDDRFEFFTNPETLCTYAAVKREREGKRKRDIDVEYCPKRGRLHIRELDLTTAPPTVKKDHYREDVPECVKDLFSALYFTRRQEIRPGTRFKALVGDNERIKEVEARVEKLETVKTPAGTFKAWKVNTVALVGGLFKEGGQFRMWLSDDAKKVPVQFEAKVNLGTVTGKLKAGQY